MSPLRMVHLATLPSEFQARVVAARLGAEGVVWELRGICSVYPVGAVDVLVEFEALDKARDMLLGAEIEVSSGPPYAEAAPAQKLLPPGPPVTSGHPWQGTALAVAVLLLIVLLSLRPLLGR